MWCGVLLHRLILVMQLPASVVLKPEGGITMSQGTAPKLAEAEPCAPCAAVAAICCASAWLYEVTSSHAFASRQSRQASNNLFLEGDQLVCWGFL